MTPTENCAQNAPITAPLYPDLPILYRNSNLLACACRANPAAIEALVPAPLEAAPGGIILANFADLRAVGQGPYDEAVINLSYHEAFISIPVTYKGNPGVYVAYMYLDSDGAIAGGREVWGFPKKLARFAFSVREGGLTRSVERGGVDLFRVSMQFNRPGNKEDLAMLRAPCYNMKIIPSVEKGTLPDVYQLTATTFENIVIHRVIEGDATIEIGQCGADPLYRLKPVEVLKGMYCEIDFDLTYGTVIHNYRDALLKRAQLASPSLAAVR